MAKQELGEGRDVHYIYAEHQTGGSGMFEGRNVHPDPRQSKARC